MSPNLELAIVSSRITSNTNSLIISIELGKKAQLSDTYVMSMRMKVFPIGLPIIHARVRKIVLENF